MTTADAILFSLFLGITFAARICTVPGTREESEPASVDLIKLRVLADNLEKR